jgi:hypothetical protein
MCFGNQTTSTQQTNYQTNPAVAQAMNQNFGFVENLQNQGFNPYGGQMVANFSPQQEMSFMQGGGVANANISPNANLLGAASSLVGNVGGANPGQVQQQNIAGGMNPFMNQYVNMALQPQVAAQQAQFAQQDQQLNAAATSSGAFGDARAGIEQANLSQQQDIASQGLFGQAYTNAFNAAGGLSSQQAASNLQAQTTNANLYNQQLQNQLAAAQGFQGILGSEQGLVGLQNTLGQQQTAQGQAGLNAQYNQWLMGQQYPFQTAQLMNQTIGAGTQAFPASSTSTMSQPNNSGWGILGSLGGSILGNSGFGSWLGSAIFASDERLKEDVKQIGELYDETPLYTFKYKGDPSRQTNVGVLAHELEVKHPELVATHPSGYKMVDYGGLTAKGLFGG